MNNQPTELMCMACPKLELCVLMSKKKIVMPGSDQCEQIRNDRLVKMCDDIETTV